MLIDGGFLAVTAEGVMCQESQFKERQRWAVRQKIQQNANLQICRIKDCVGFADLPKRALC
jgi:hypothetical protein